MGFRAWRKKRPLGGGIITTLSGLLISWAPFNLFLSAFLPGSLVIIGVIFGGLITILGICAISFPNASRILGIFTIFLSILSIIGALGGFFVGTIMGIIGGALLVGFRLVPVTKDDDITPSNGVDEAVSTF